MWGECPLPCSNPYEIAITIIFDISSSFRAWIKLATALEVTRKGGTIAEDSLPLLNVSGNHGH